MAMSTEKCVRVEESDTCGRRKLVATSSFPPGKCILEELPYAYTLNYDKMGHFCTFCLKQSSTLSIKCSSCEYVRYCTTLCKEEDLKRCHEHDCKVQERYPDMVHLLSQIIQKQSLRSTQVYKNGFPTTVDPLVSHHKELSVTIRNEFPILLQQLKQFIAEDDLPEASSLFEMYGKTICNSFSICDDDLNGIAVGIYLRASMLNHSCDPNCVVVFDERKLRLSTIKDVNEGEECTISYIKFLSTPTKERRAELEENFHFTCKCVKCCIEKSNALEPDDVLAEELRGLEKSFKQIQDASESQNCTKVLELCEPYLNLKPSCLPADHQLLVAVRAKAFGERINTQSWEKAAEIGQLITKPYKDHYGPYNPILGIHLLRMGKLLVNLNRLQEAITYFKEAESVLKVTHGPQHSLMASVKGLLDL